MLFNLLCCAVILTRLEAVIVEMLYLVFRCSHLWVKNIYNSQSLPTNYTSFIDPNAEVSSFTTHKPVFFPPRWPRRNTIALSGCGLYVGAELMLE